MQDKTTIYKQRIINILFYVNVSLTVMICMLLLINNIIIKNQQRQIAEMEEQFIGLSVEECEGLLGASFISYENEIHYDGGTEWQLELGALLCYREYKLILFLDDNQNVQEARTIETLEIFM